MSSSILRASTLEEVEHVVDQLEQGLGRGTDRVDVGVLLGQQGCVQQQVRQADDGVHRRPDLVAHVGEELPLGLVRRLGRPLCLPERRGALLDQPLELLGRHGRGVHRLHAVSRRRLGRPVELDWSAMTASEELVEVVDSSGAVTAVVPRWQMRARRLRHRAVFVAVFDGDGRLLVHRRSDHKDLWPGWWDLAVGGVVAVGESWAAAARRELAEEVGIDGAVPVELGGGVYADADVDLVGRVFRVEHDGPLRFGDGEVVEAVWVDAAGLASRLAVDRFLPDSRALVLPLLGPPWAGLTSPGSLGGQS
jgi:isopentenyldiphosphate isomerase